MASDAAQPQSNRTPMFMPWTSSSADAQGGTTEAILRHPSVQSYLLRPKGWLARTICLAAWSAAIAGVCAATWLLAPLLLKKVMLPLQTKVQEEWPPAAVAALVVAGVVVLPTLLVPAGAFIWLAAVSFGAFRGFLIVQFATALGMTTSYLLGKLLLRKRITRWVEHKDWAQALFLAVQEAGPFKVVLLMRLGPAPYAWLSYACSLSSDIRFGPYIAASILGRSPHNLIDIYIGSSVRAADDVASGKELDPVLIASYVIGFIIAAGVTIAAYWYAKRALRDIRARVLARNDALEAFEFKNLDADEAAVPDLPDLTASGAFKTLDGSGRRTTVELISVATSAEPEAEPLPLPRSAGFSSPKAGQARRQGPGLAEDRRRLLEEFPGGRSS